MNDILVIADKENDLPTGNKACNRCRQLDVPFLEAVDVKLKDIITTSEPDDPFNGEEQPFVSML